MNKLFLALAAVILLGAAPVLAADTYKIDPAHSNIGFTVKHMMISNTSGQFDDVDGTVVYDPNDLENSKVDVIIQADSIDTHQEKRDAHLKSADFFDVENFPTITFVSTKMSPTEIVGNLTIKGVTKEITIPVTIAGPVMTMGGKPAIGLEGAVVINRQDYGVKWNKDLDKGGVAVANDVKVSFSVEAVKE